MKYKPRTVLTFQADRSTDLDRAMQEADAALARVRSQRVQQDQLIATLRLLSEEYAASEPGSE